MAALSKWIAALASLQSSRSISRGEAARVSAEWHRRHVLALRRLLVNIGFALLGTHFGRPALKPDQAMYTERLRGYSTSVARRHEDNDRSVGSRNGPGAV